MYVVHGMMSNGVCVCVRVCARCDPVVFVLHGSPLNFFDLDPACLTLTLACLTLTLPACIHYHSSQGQLILPQCHTQLVFKQNNSLNKLQLHVLLLMIQRFCSLY